MKLKKIDPICIFILNHKSKNCCKPMLWLKNYWKNIFLSSVGLAAGAGFCMKWIEPAIRVADKKVGVLDLELFYSRDQIDQVLASGDSRFQDLLSQHLYFDFAFMAGIFPAIAAGCMVAVLNTEKKILKKIFYVLAAL